MRHEHSISGLALLAECKTWEPASLTSRSIFSILPLSLRIRIVFMLLRDRYTLVRSSGFLGLSFLLMVMMMLSEERRQTV